MTRAPTASVPILGFCAFSGTGKTTLLKRLLPLLRDAGLRVGMIKHSHHRFDIDIPGKDSYELRQAGASQMLIASRYRWALMVDSTPESEPTLQQLLDRLDQRNLDLILVEGFRDQPFPKIELHRPALGKPMIHLEDDHVIAIASDAGLPVDPPLPLLDLNDPDAIAGFILTRLGR